MMCCILCGCWRSAGESSMHTSFMLTVFVCDFAILLRRCFVFFVDLILPFKKIAAFNSLRCAFLLCSRHQLFVMKQFTIYKPGAMLFVCFFLCLSMFNLCVVDVWCKTRQHTHFNAVLWEVWWFHKWWLIFVVMCQHTISFPFASLGLLHVLMFLNVLFVLCLLVLFVFRLVVHTAVPLWMWFALDALLYVSFVLLSWHEGDCPSCCIPILWLAFSNGAVACVYVCAVARFLFMRAIVHMAVPFSLWLTYPHNRNKNIGYSLAGGSAPCTPSLNVT